MSDPQSDNSPSFAHPKFWPTWCLIWLLKLLAKCSHSKQIRMGYLLGKVGYHLAIRRRKIAARNIELCFPELTASQQRELIERTMIDNMIGLFETLWAWYGDTSDMQQRLRIEGAEELHQAMALGRGVLLVGAHYTTLDLGGLMIKPVAPTSAVYMRNKNPLLDKFIYEGRMRNMATAIDRWDMRSIVRTLKKGAVLWYSPDQDFGSDHSVFAPFFGVEAASVRMTAKLASFNNSPVVVVSHHREPDDQHYCIRFRPALENYPTGDERADAAAINAVLEEEIRRCPSQYMWVHRRFKTRPPGEKPLY